MNPQLAEFIFISSWGEQKAKANRLPQAMTYVDNPRFCGTTFRDALIGGGRP